jgi:hypothetical protein
MSVFGGGCLNVWSEGLPSAESPRSPSPPQGHLRCSKVCWPDLDRCGLGGGFPRSPLEARAVDPDAMEDNGDFAGNGHLGLLGTDPLHLPDAPSFQSRPALGSMKQHTCRLEQVAPQQSVARLGYPFGRQAAGKLGRHGRPSGCRRLSQPAKQHPIALRSTSEHAWRRRRLKVAHVRLCHSRMLFVQAYPRETQEILLNTFLDIQDELREQVLLRPGLSIGGAWEHADVSRWLATGASRNCARQRSWPWTQTAVRQLSGGGA